jgi:uncharacterized protein
MNKYFKILEKYSISKRYFDIVLRHSLAVLEKSIDIIARKKLYKRADFDLVISGCLLHDIGAFEFMRNFDEEQEDYILHGIIGGKILRKEGFYKEALIAERHIGAGLSKNYITRKKLPLPKKDFLPITLEQKIICYADKFHSKSGKKDTLKSIKKEMEKYGQDPLKRFLELEKMFG